MFKYLLNLLFLMIRKVIQLAGKTSVISLPLPWVRKYNIEKGAELELIERGREIIIKTNKDLQIDRIVININDLDEQSIKWTLSALHKFGYDEIEVVSDKEEYFQVLNDMVKDILLGFVIMQQTSKKVVLKSVSNDVESEFDMALRRAFLVTLSLGEGIVSKLKQNNNDFSDLYYLEKVNNQFTNFCERLLNKKGFRDFRKTCFYYVIVWNLEKICDVYADLCKVLERTEITNHFILLIEKTNEVFKGYYNLFYNFENKKLVELDKLILELLDNISSLKLYGEEYSCLKGILSRTREFLASTIAINHEKHSINTFS